LSDLRKILLTDYSESTGISYQTLVDRIKRSKLKGVKENNRWWVFVEDKNDESNSNKDENYQDEQNFSREISINNEKLMALLEREQQLRAQFQSQIEAKERLSLESGESQNKTVRYAILGVLGSVVFMILSLIFVWNSYTTELSNIRQETKNLINEIDLSSKSEIEKHIINQEKQIQAINLIKDQALDKIEGNHKNTLEELKKAYEISINKIEGMKNDEMLELKAKIEELSRLNNNLNLKSNDQKDKSEVNSGNNEVGK